MAQVLNLQVEGYTRSNLSAIIGVGTLASAKIWSVIPVAGASEMIGVSPAERKGVRNAETTAETRGNEARHARPFVGAGRLPAPPVFPCVRGTRIR